MTKQEKALHDSVIATYQHNLKLLSYIDTDLLARIDTLSDAINTGAYPERYSLEFIKENGDFDIFDTNTQKYIYNKKPRQWNNKAVNSIDFDSLNSINLVNFKEKIVDITEMKNSIFDINSKKTITDISNFSNILSEYETPKTKNFKKFLKFIFIGSLLGRHIYKIGHKFGCKHYFIMEQNLEIFRLSLFACDYSVLLQNDGTVSFSIMDDDADLFKKLDNFFNLEITSNTVYKFYSTNYGVQGYLDKITNAVLSRDPHLFDYNSRLYNITKSLSYVFGNFKVLNFGKVNQNQSANIADIPVLFIGAGPSLSQNMAWLKENHKKFLIVAMAATLKTLEKNDITPDIITSTDPQFAQINNQLNIQNTQMIENAIKVFSINTDQKIFEKFQDSSKIYTFETLVAILNGNKIANGISIGEVTFHILLFLNFKNIFMLGIDLALDQKTGGTHDDSLDRKNSTYDISEQSLSQNEITKKQTYSIREDLIKVPGNFLPEVVTTRLFALSLNEYNNCSQQHKKEWQTIINMSENGAKIQNTLSIRCGELNFEDLPNIEKTNLAQSITKMLDQISCKRLDQSTQEKLKSELQAIGNFKKILADNISTNFETFDSFKKFCDDRFYEILKTIGTQNFLAEILINYYFIINRYIDFCFNDQKIKNESALIYEVSFAWIMLTTNIVSQYQKELELLLKTGE